MGRSKKREVKYETRSAKHLDSSLGRYPYSPERFLLKTRRFSKNLFFLLILAKIRVYFPLKIGEI